MAVFSKVSSSRNFVHGAPTGRAPHPALRAVTITVNSSRALVEANMTDYETILDGRNEDRPQYLTATLDGQNITGTILPYQS